MNINYKILEVAKNIIAIEVEDQYDRAMLFCRVQEYFESDSIDFRGKQFDIWDFIKYYSENNNGFTYSVDWGGFNFPFKILLNCYNNQSVQTPYDDIMLNKIIPDIIKMNIDSDKCYIIGVEKINDVDFDDNLILEHEIAHGLFFNNEEYKDNVKSILKECYSEKDLFLLYHNLSLMGYGHNVLLDEVHAYTLTDFNYWKFSDGVGLTKRKKAHKKLKKLYLKTKKADK